MKDLKLKRGFNLQEAMDYLGIKRKAFETYFRPFLTPVKFGTSLVFDVVDLDSLMDKYVSRNERLILKGEAIWADKVASTKMTAKDGALIKSTAAQDFESVSKALKKQKTG